MSGCGGCAGNVGGRQTLGAEGVALRSPILASGGFRVYDGLFDAATHESLLAEAVERYATSAHQECWLDGSEQGRGGTPRRRLLTAEAGPAQDSLYGSEWLLRVLSRECALPVKASGNRGSYSYYTRPGDFLDLHLDVVTCDLTLITVLEDNSDPMDGAGALVLYPGRIGEPLGELRRDPYSGGVAVKVVRGQSILLLGGIVPHRLQPVRGGQVRIISVLCFELAL